MKYLYFTCLLLICFIYPKAQNQKYEYVVSKEDTLFKDVRFYGGLVHQHQDFFNKTFSFQGLEAGAIINNKVIIGIYGSAFASNLEVKLATVQSQINIFQSGIIVGTIKNDFKVLHTGWLLNIGYFSLEYDSSNFSIFKTNSSTNRIEGLILSPQIYAELNITKWMKFMTGLGYSFYSFPDHSKITNSNLQNISLNFGFIFGKFN